MKLWIIAIAALGLGLATHLTLQGAADAPPPAATSTAPPTAKAARPRPAPWIAELALPSPRDRATAPDAAREAAPAAVAAPPSEAEVRGRFDTVFTAERIDAAWHRGAADAVTRGLAAALPAGSAVRSVECRGTMCRIETSHTDPEAFRDYARRAFLDPDTRLTRSGFFASLAEPPTGGGDTVGVAFIAREGHELPGPEALFAGR
jgi:hypothetical protein